MINQVLIATTSDVAEADAKNAIDNRSLLYNKDKKKLFVKYNDELNKIGANPDNKNIVENANGDIALKDIPSVNGVNISQNGSDVWRGQRKLCEINPAHLILFFKEEDKTYIGGEILQKGLDIISHYDISLTSTGSRSLRGATSDDEKANFITCTYQGAKWYGLRFYSGKPTKVFFTGYYTKQCKVVGVSEVSDLVDLTSDADTGTVIINGIGGTYLYEFDVHIPVIQNFGDHYGFNYDHYCQITTHKNTRQEWKAQINDDVEGINIGRLVCQAATGANDPILTLYPDKKADFNILFSSTNGSPVDLRVDYKGGGISTTSNNKDHLARLGFSRANTDGPFKISANGPVNIWLVSYQEEIIFDDIIDDIDKLPETGAHGTPHIIRLSDQVLDRKKLLELAESCQNSKTQVILDLAECTVANDAKDWYDGGGSNTGRHLTSLFSGCKSLRAFAFPQGVIKGGERAFENCPSLERVIFNPELNSIGLPGWGNDSMGYFSGTAMSFFWMPKTIVKGQGSSLPGWLYANSSIVDVWFEPNCFIIREWDRNYRGKIRDIFGWGYFAYADDRLRFHCPCHKNPDGTWNENDGELYSKLIHETNNHIVSSMGMNINSTKYMFKDKPIGSMCIPYDITKFEIIKKKMTNLYDLDTRRL